MLIAIVASGPQKGRVLELSDGQRVTLGRESDFLPLTDSRASRRHAELFFEAGCWYVADVGSRHGTYRNNKQVIGKARLKDGDRIQVGQTVFVLARVAADHAEASRGEPIRTTLTARDIAALLPPAPRGRPLLRIAACLAVAGAIGFNGWFYIQWIQRDAEMQLALLSQFRMQPNREQRLHEVRQVVEDQAKRTEPILRNMLARLDAQPSKQERVAEVREVVEAQAAEAAPLFESIFAQLREQPDAEQRLAEIRQEVQAQAKQTQPILQDILRRLEAQPDAEQRLAEIRSVVDAQFARTEPLFKDIYGQIEKFREVSVDALVQAVRTELHEQLERAIPAAAQARTAAAPVNPHLSALGIDASGGMALGQLQSNAPITVTAAAARDLPPTIGLTRLQQAYKEAFETGRPVTVGAGILNPLTLEKSKGRTLDPQIAYKAGIERWQDWYLAENYQEQVRLRGQAERFIEDRLDRPAAATPPPPVIVRTPFDTAAPPAADASGDVPHP